MLHLLGATTLLQVQVWWTLPVAELVYLSVPVPVHLAEGLPVPLGLVLQTLVRPRLGVLHLLLQLVHPGV